MFFLPSSSAHHNALGLRLQPSHQQAQLIEFDGKRTDIPAPAPGIHRVLLQQTIPLRRMDDGLLAVPLQRLKAREEHARRQHEPQIRLRQPRVRRRDEVLDGLVALLQRELCAGVVRLARVDDAGEEFLVQGADGGEGVPDAGFVVPGLEHHLLPEGAVEVSGQLRGGVPDEEVERVLFLSVVAPCVVAWSAAIRSSAEIELAESAHMA